MYVSGLWYLRHEGKVRQEWVGDICEAAGTTRAKLMEAPSVWHVLKVNA